MDIILASDVSRSIVYALFIFLLMTALFIQILFSYFPYNRSHLPHDQKPFSIRLSSMQHHRESPLPCMTLSKQRGTCIGQVLGKYKHIEG